MGGVIQFPLPPRGPLMRRLFWLIERSEVVDRHRWATDLLHRPIPTFRRLTSAEINFLIWWLVLDGRTPKPCRSALDGRYCIHTWPDHPQFCTDIMGNEWLAREI